MNIYFKNPWVKTLGLILILLILLLVINKNQAAKVHFKEETATTATKRIDELIPYDKELYVFLGANQRIQRAYYYGEEIGCPPSVLIAQYILESRMGKSDLTKKTKNHGNIKCMKCSKGNFCGKGCVPAYDKIEKTTDYYLVKSHAWEGWSHTARLLKNYRIIKKQKYSAKDYKDWCLLFHKSPYATDPDYDDKLINIIEKYKLYNLDTWKGEIRTMSTGKYVLKAAN